MQVGWDWASETHDVTVMDIGGQVVERWSLTHDEAGLDQAIGRLARHGRPTRCRWRSRPPTAWSWTGCWPPVTRWCRCIPTLSTPPGLGGAPPGPSPIRWQLEAGRLPAYRRPPAAPPAALG